MSPIISLFVSFAEGRILPFFKDPGAGRRAGPGAPPVHTKESGATSGQQQLDSGDIVARRTPFWRILPRDR